jgi:hypothetical protein
MRNSCIIPSQLNDYFYRVFCSHHLSIINQADTMKFFRKGVPLLFDICSALHNVETFGKNSKSVSEALLLR